MTTQGPVLLVFDVDGTLVGEHDERTSEEFAQLADLMCLVKKIKSDRPGSKLVYSTGRTVESLNRLSKNVSPHLPAPDFLVCSNGTELYLSDGTPVTEYDHYVSHAWDKELVLSAIEEVVGLIPDLKTTKHSRHRVALLCGSSSFKRAMTALESALANGAQAVKYMMLRSQEWLDIMPYRAGKGNAVEFLMRTAPGFDMAICCGDGENDLDMLRPPFRGVVVANAMPDMVDALQDGEHIYFAQSKIACGVKEGVEYWLDPTRGLHHPMKPISIVIPGGGGKTTLVGNCPGHAGSLVDIDIFWDSCGDLESAMIKEWSAAVEAGDEHSVADLVDKCVMMKARRAALEFNRSKAAKKSNCAVLLCQTISQALHVSLPQDVLVAVPSQLLHEKALRARADSERIASLCRSQRQAILDDPRVSKKVKYLSTNCSEVALGLNSDGTLNPYEYAEFDTLRDVVMKCADLAQQR